MFTSFGEDTGEKLHETSIDTKSMEGTPLVKVSYDDIGVLPATHDQSSIKIEHAFDPIENCQGNTPRFESRTQTKEEKVTIDMANDSHWKKQLHTAL